jgi:hypothetical protein
VERSEEEVKLRGSLPVYVGSFNQPSYVQQMVETLLANGFGNVIIADNASTSRKTLSLLESYDSRAGVRVWRLGENIGPSLTVRRIGEQYAGAFIFTDPDLELSPVLPRDFLLQLFSISRRYRTRKVGLALEIPAPGEARDLRFFQAGLGKFTVEQWERQFWREQLEPGVYRANIDTTFFLWNSAIKFDPRRDYLELRSAIRPQRLARMLPSLRQIDIRIARSGYVARHLPWYIQDLFPSDEREYYIQSTSRVSTWLRDVGSDGFGGGVESRQGED